jgi:hypothetical protein
VAKVKNGFVPRVRDAIFPTLKALQTTNCRLWAHKMGVGERCVYIAGDMFQEVPAADAYLLKHILHDWSDSIPVSVAESSSGR